jgi:CRP-like cAMP-binding protein
MRTETLSPTDLDWLSEKLGLGESAPMEPSFAPLLSALPAGLYIYEPGEAILREGEKGTDVYVLRSGSALAEQTMDQPAPLELGELAEGDCFGEIGFLLKEPRTADVTAQTECRVFRFKADNLICLMEANPKLKKYLQSVAQNRLVKIFTEKL